jgi:hypothetical protein
LPVRAALHPSGLYLMQRAIPRGELTDPFLVETTSRLPGPDSFLHVEPQQLGRLAPAEAPAGLIFHLSRCGSTLLTQMLRRHPGVTVYSEPQAINEILFPPHPWPRAQLVAALRSTAAALSRHANGPYVIKFTSWTTLYCDLLAEAFPHSPWAFSWRDPLEVAVSLTQSLPGWFRDEQGKRLARIVDPENAATSPDGYAARAIGAMAAAALSLNPASGRLIAYEHLPGAVWDDLGPHFGLNLDHDIRARMADAATLNAKKPATAFVPDAATKRAAASPELIAAVDAHARPPLAKLLALHAGRI